MNARPRNNLTSARIMAVALMTAGILATARAQTPLQGQFVLSPVSSHEISSLGLPSSTELSGGLSTVGVGTAVYLEADVNLAVPTADITSVTWNLVSKPTGSAAYVTNATPFGTNNLIYEPSSRLVSQVAGRAFLRPDIAGQYTVTLSITTASEGSTNLTQTITAGTYLGVQTCELCHSGGQIAEDKWSTWVQTLHAQVFSNEIDANANFTGAPMRQSCLQCHTTGYDPNTNATDGGFYNLQMLYGWTIPPVLTNGNYTSLQQHYPSLAGLANVQCESCHGPGSVHADLLGNTNSPNWPGVAVDDKAVGDCNQCHDDAPYHPYGTEWLNSVHAVTTTDPAGSASCVGCHTGKGFIARVEGITNNVDTSYNPINCQACHEPHGATIPANNPHMIRTLASVTLQDGTVITNAGEGLLCMECHQARVKASTAATVYNSHFGPHHGPQADMLEGANGYTYGQVIASSDHAAISNTCVACHMQIIPSSDPAFLYAGSHTFNVGWAGSGTNGPENLVAACQTCHGPTATSFNFPVENFDGYDLPEGVQTQVQNLLNQVALLLPGGEANITAGTVTPQPNWTVPQLEAAYNYLFVQSDGSLGVHNTAYAVGLLKASIANLTGSSVAGGLPDAWVDQYFGSVTNPNGAPNAINNTNGIPNWMMYALGLNPTQSGTTVPNGVVWVDGASLDNGGPTNTVHIYTAAEVSFNTTVGNTYQIQAITQLSGGWGNIGSPITGTGAAVSYLTSTRNHPQMFFRVLTNP
ncbi:MAG TPA: cytochrome c3 family protein [Verrucomicrobiae bacterium]|nr:cytochrome c3 family protein [Verrucomicrobiae bacterium]